MPNKVIKGNIKDYERSEKHDDEGYKIINYRIRVNNEKYTVHLSRGINFYFDENLEVILYVDENNVAIAGLCPKKDLKWGNTKPIDNEVQPSDRFELAEGIVLEKQRESFNDYSGDSKTTTVTYTIILPDKRFRVHETIGKHIKPNTDIVALTENGVAYLIKDNSNNKIYGKPSNDYIIAIVLWLAFNIAMIVAANYYNKELFASFNMTMIIGNLVFGIGFLISFSAFLSSTKTLKIFYQMLDRRR